MILTINDFEKCGYGISDMLYHMGVVSISASPGRAYPDISESIKCVILLSPEDIRERREYAEALRAYTEAPIFAIYDRCEPEDRVIFDKVFTSYPSAPEFLEEIIRYTRERGLVPPAAYKTERIDASVKLLLPRFDGCDLPLTKSETMILRAVITHHPAPIRAERILRSAFRNTRMPELSCVRTHISLLNKKFRKAYGENLITQINGKGYGLAIF